MTGGTPIINQLVNRMASSDTRSERITIGQEILNHVDLLTSYSDDMSSQRNGFENQYKDLLRQLEIGKQS